MQERKEIAVNGSRYRIRQLGALNALSVLHILGRVTTPLMSEAVVDDLGAAAQEFGKRLGDVLERLSEQDLRKVVDILADSTWILETPGMSTDREKGMKLSTVFDSHFAGKGLANMIVWAKESLMFNFADFLSGLGALTAGEGAGSFEGAPPSSQTE